MPGTPGPSHSVLRLLAVCGVVAAIGGAGPRSAAASCIQTAPLQQFLFADVIFDGIALDHPNATGIERFGVLRYLKSSGPGVIRVRTGRTPSLFTSASISPVTGETWRIYGKRAAGTTVSTNVCLGSRRLQPARPTLTVTGRFGTRFVVDRGTTSRPRALFVRTGDRLALRFSFLPTSLVVRFGRSQVRRLPARETVMWRVPPSGTYPVRFTAAGVRTDASGTRFTSRFLFRLSVLRG